MKKSSPIGFLAGLGVGCEVDEASGGFGGGEDKEEPEEAPRRIPLGGGLGGETAEFPMGADADRPRPPLLWLRLPEELPLPRLPLPRLPLLDSREPRPLLPRPLLPRPLLPPPPNFAAMRSFASRVMRA